jgi:26S proteasome regulatory subunit N6
VDYGGRIPNSATDQIAMCKDSIQWTIDTKRVFLRQRLQLRLYQLYLDTKEYEPALSGVAELLSEVKRLDDKSVLLEVPLLLSSVHFLPSFLRTFSLFGVRRYKIQNPAFLFADRRRSSSWSR